MSNFDFLKPIDTNLFEIISEAEKLYRDEYFEQCIGQIRRFGENVCKNVLGSNRTTENSFDDMLATLKDKPNKTEEEKEFLDDLYFIKREGNASVHSGTVQKDGIIALECLQRAFEIAINYSVFHKQADRKILNLHYDTEELITGKKTPKSLAEKYQKAKEKSTTKKSKPKNKPQKQTHTMPTKAKAYSKETHFPLKLLAITIGISTLFLLIIFLLTI